tara:strand:+ start:604 stop:780 length:177 start_codon:yes stop_codon:yes gene_type:complete
MVNREFDFIIVGADSEGCGLADQLSAYSHNRVLIVEGGGADGLPPHRHGEDGNDAMPV